ncbi:MAG: molybdopterin-synthase adenylyltransferase MoeB [Chloroflexi bacterium]|nr:molybdopterin-synthase adenylyltransferase MoeB [Chloroflexota bacterium]
MFGFTEEQIYRYSRHIILPQVGGVGQKKLLASKVLLIGAGGLGSPAGLYLAAAGVGTLGLVDYDAVDLSNLHRQILFTSEDIRRPKTEVAQEALRRVNPDVKVIPHQTVLTSENALEILRDYDVVINGSDNFPTRYLVNDACVFLKKPLVDASVLMFDAQLTTFDAQRGPCYRCLFPTPPPPGEVPSCQEAGVLGALTGAVGSLQAVEALKLRLGIGEPLIGRLLILDGLSMDIHFVRYAKNRDCPVCGEDPSITQLIDYEEFCGVPHRQPAEAAQI